MTVTQCHILAFTVALVLSFPAFAQEARSDPAAMDSVAHSRAVETAIWGMPIASFHALRESFARDAGAAPMDIVYLSRPADWKLQVPTPNATTLYALVMSNTRDGPLVLEVPPSKGASLFGSFNDAWHEPVVDLGPAGEDQGRGGKYLLVPPGYEHPVPAGYIAVRFKTYNGYAGIRAIPDTDDDAGVAAALAMVRRLRLYPLARAANLPAQKYIDMSGRVWNGIAALDETFYTRLAAMIDEEPPRPRDMIALQMLATLGIEKGKPFTPDAKVGDLLSRAAREAQAQFLRTAEALPTFSKGSYWRVPLAMVGPETGFTYERNGRLDFDNRGQTFFELFAPPARLGGATFYLGVSQDANGNPLVGDKAYRLRVPPNVPARQFWAVTVYSQQTAAFIRESPRVEVNSFQQLSRNADGSVDVYFSERPPAGHETNWAYIRPGERWFPYFRWYGPEPALFDHRWVLPNIEEVK